MPPQVCLAKRFMATGGGNSIPRLTWPRVLSFRLRRQGLASRTARDRLAEAAGEATGIQAQLSSAAEIGLWCRVEGIHPRDVERALWKERTLIKTWAMRGALHLLPAEELAVYLGGLRREGLLREKQWMSRHGLKEDDFQRMSHAVSDALTSGPLTRRELADAVVSTIGRAARPWVEHTWGGVVRLACMEGLACFGPDRGREITFVSMEDWLPDFAEEPKEHAETALARRYLRAHGPASPKDFASWSGMRVTTAREIWRRMEGEIAEVSLEGRKAHILAEDLQFANQPPIESVRLLPHFDTYLLAHGDKGHLVDDTYYKHIYRKAGWVSRTLLVNGRAAGTWSARRSRSILEVEVEPFSELESDLRDLVTKEARDLGKFLGAPAQTVFQQASS